MSVDLAKGRFIALTIVRLLGVALALLGLAIIAGKIGVPREVGYLFFVIGLLEALILPIILTRKWKTPRP